MRKIFKYELHMKADGKIDLQLPKDSSPVHIAVDNKTGIPCMWVDFQTENEKDLQKYSFLIVGTGQEFDENNDYYHMSSFQEGPFVWHLYAR